MTRNKFDVNRSIALAHVGSEQLKALFLAKTKQILVCLSGTMMFLGVLMTAGNIKIEWSVDALHRLMAATPVAIPTFFFAVVIEGGTLLASSMYRVAKRKVELGLEALAKTKNNLTDEEKKQKRVKIERKMYTPLVIMCTCVFFSVSGAELFWQKILENTDSLFFHFIGFVLGLTCSALLILFELNEDLVEEIVERTISSSALIQKALVQSTKASIHDQLFTSNQKLLKSSEFQQAIDGAAQQGLYGTLAESLESAGITIGQERLRQDIEDRRIAHAAAEAYLSSGDEKVLEIAPPVASKTDATTRDTPQLKRVRAAIKKYSRKEIRENLDRFAKELSMSERTIVRHLNTLEGRKRGQ